MRQPGAGRPAPEPGSSPAGGRVAGAGTLMDRLDAAFLARLTGAPGDDVTAVVPVSRPVPPTTRIARSDGVSAPGPVGPNGSTGRWDAIVDRVVTAAHRVVALAGAGTAVGLDGLAERIGAALAVRGIRVDCRRGPVLMQRVDAEGDDPDVILVVGGDWFPAGPVNVRRLVALACGCDAVVLVRPAARPPCPAHAEALAALGIALVASIDGADLAAGGAPGADA